MFDPPDISPPASASPLSRRRFLVGGIAAGTAVACGLLFTDGPASADAKQLNAPGKVLEGAQRMSLVPVEEPPIDDSPPDDSPSDEPPSDDDTPGEEIVMPTDGEILFPIVVGPDDRAYLNDNFGACRGTGCTRSHEGTDIMADQGLAIRAVAAGELTKRYVDSGSTSGAGNGWTVKSADTGIAWKFFHMDRHEDGLEVGDTVEIGQVIGYVGNTGTSGAKSKSNYHLHFEYRPGNVAQNSFALLQRDPNVDFY